MAYQNNVENAVFTITSEMQPLEWHHICTFYLFGIQNGVKLMMESAWPKCCIFNIITNAKFLMSFQMLHLWRNEANNTVSVLETVEMWWEFNVSNYLPAPILVSSSCFFMYVKSQLSLGHLISSFMVQWNVQGLGLIALHFSWCVYIHVHAFTYYYSYTFSSQHYSKWSIV